MTDALRVATECRLDSIDDVWDIDDMDVADELRDAIERVREDHDHTEFIEFENVWVLQPRWNEETDSVWVSAYGYRAGLTTEE